MKLISKHLLFEKQMEHYLKKKFALYPLYHNLYDIYLIPPTFHLLVLERSLKHVNCRPIFLHRVYYQLQIIPVFDYLSPPN